MLKKNKRDKIIIMTTHYMDEADILGDRICIMSEGQIQCTGSSLFLKNRYGVGYNLVIAKKDRKPNPEIEKFVKSKIPIAILLQEVSSEITFQLPTEASNFFGSFFTDFDNNLESLNIRTYSVGVTTLEEVFLKIGHGEEIEKERENKGLSLNNNKDKSQATHAEKVLDEYSIATY